MPTKEQLNAIALHHIDRVPKPLHSTMKWMLERAIEKNQDVFMFKMRNKRQMRSIWDWMKRNVGKLPFGKVESLRVEEYIYTSPAGSVVLAQPRKLGRPPTIHYTSSIEDVWESRYKVPRELWATD
jgi:hypothetical protein